MTTRTIPMTARPRPMTALAIGATAIGGALLTQAPALAHTGHTTAGASAGLLHPLGGPDHLLAMLAIGIVAAYAGTRRIMVLTPLGFLLGMVLGGALALGSMTLPGVELAIALSIIALGALGVARIRRDTLLLPAAAVMFGLAHGQAHGAEIPLSASPLTYAIGFLAASAVVHLMGGLGGRALRRAPQARLAAGALISSAGIAILFGV